MKTSIICLIYKSTKYLEFVHKQILKYTDLENTEFYFVANDANEDVINYLKSSNIKHYIFTNSPENIAAHNVTNYYLDNVYRAWNFGAQMAKGENIVFINSDMAFSPNWLENLYKYHTPNNCVTSRLFESGRYPSGTHGMTFDCGKFLRDYDENKFLNSAICLSKDEIHDGGLYMPLLIKKEHFIKVNGYPEGNIVPDSDIFNPIIAKKNNHCIPGDIVFMSKLSTLGIRHQTSFSSIVYHFQNGEMFE